MTSATLVLGGARSGKSEYAESLMRGAPLLYIATGQAGDGEMATRIERHRLRRGAAWITVEEPLDVADALRRTQPECAGVLVDCVTLWISNLMHGGRDVGQACDALCDALTGVQVPVVLVSSEVGLGLVPETALGREFRDHQGIVNQRLAQVCGRVVFVAAGLPMILKNKD